ncbi:MAG: hypothetical protein FJ143_00235 [Deltaproteobacteria bacterium]|nr:hypothetical protein [Deltaproteobacteria bacterium]
MKILTPTLTNSNPKIPIAPRQPALDGKNWGFVDTSKVNADLFIAELQGEIRQHHQARSFVTIRKEAPGFPLSAEQLQRLKSSCDVVILCFGD